MPNLIYHLSFGGLYLNKSMYLALAGGLGFSFFSGGPGKPALAKAAFISGF